MHPTEYSIVCSRVRGGILHPWRVKRASYTLPGPVESASLVLMMISAALLSKVPSWSVDFSVSESGV